MSGGAVVFLSPLACGSISIAAYLPEVRLFLGRDLIEVYA